MKFTASVPVTIFETIHGNHVQQFASRADFPIEAESPEAAVQIVAEALASLVRASTAPIPTPAKSTKLRAVRGPE